MTFLISFIPFIFTFYFLFNVRKKQSVKLNISWGERCWKCKVSLERDLLKPTELRLCQSCNRDIKIENVSSNILLVKNKFRKFVLSDSFRTFLHYLIFVNLFFLLIYIFVTVCYPFKYNWIFLTITTSLNSTFWILLIFQDHYSSIKKPSDV